MLVMPILYVRDPARSRAFYESLGLAVSCRSRPGSWVELQASGGVVALHRSQGQGTGTVELCFVSEGPLEQVRNQVVRSGHPEDKIGEIVDEEFGRSMRLVDPDGIEVQVNEHDQELYS